MSHPWVPKIDWTGVAKHLGDGGPRRRPGKLQYRNVYRVPKEQWRVLGFEARHAFNFLFREFCAHPERYRRDGDGDPAEIVKIPPDQWRVIAGNLAYSAACSLQVGIGDHSVWFERSVTDSIRHLLEWYVPRRASPRPKKRKRQKNRARSRSTKAA